MTGDAPARVFIASKHHLLRTTTDITYGRHGTAAKDSAPLEKIARLHAALKEPRSHTPHTTSNRCVPSHRPYPNPLTMTSLATAAAKPQADKDLLKRVQASTMAFFETDHW